MNRCIFVGRLTRDPEVRYTDGPEQTVIARFSMAVDRRVRRESDNQTTADFPQCVAFGKMAQFAEKYLKKGTKIVFEGRLQTGSYTNRDGVKVYTNDFIAENIEFAESKASQEQNGGNNARNTGNGNGQQYEGGFMEIPDGISDELPFN